MIQNKTSTFEKQLEIIKSEMTFFEYEQIKLLDATKAYIDSNATQVTIPNIYQHTKQTTIGTCSELMITLSKILNSHIPDAYVYCAIGNEEQYFFSTPKRTRTHNFCLVSEQPLISCWNITEKEQELENIKQKKPYVADPSFGILDEITNTNYSLKRVSGEDILFQTCDDFCIREKQSRPLFIEEHTLISLLFTPIHNTPFSFEFKQQYDTIGKVCSIEHVLSSANYSNKAKEYAKAISSLRLITDESYISKKQKQTVTQMIPKF